MISARDNPWKTHHTRRLYRLVRLRESFPHLDEASVTLVKKAILSTYIDMVDAGWEADARKILETGGTVPERWWK